MGKPCRVCLGRDYITGMTDIIPRDILLSLAGRVPDLAFTHIQL